MAGLLSPLPMGPLQGLTPMAGPQQAFPAAPAQPSPFAGIGQRLRGLLDPTVALPMAGALMAGRTPGESFGNAFMLGGQAIGQQREKQKRDMQRNATLQLLAQKRPDLVPWLENGAIEPADAFKVLYGDSKATDDISEYQYAVKQGFGGNFTDYMTEMKKAGAASTNVTVGGGRFGTIPQGYELIEGPQGATMRPIPGGPEDTSRKDALRAGQQRITSDTVVDAASKAREALDSGILPTTGTLGRVASGLSESGAAEVRRQVDALRAVAASENINAMRQASPTGGALGNASDADIKLLKDKAGALDPDAGRETFLRQLDDYERTLLRIVHGPELGDIIYQQTRKQGGSADGWFDLGGGVRLRRKPD